MKQKYPPLWYVAERHGIDRWERVGHYHSLRSTAISELHATLRRVFKETGNDPSDDFRLFRSEVTP